MSPAAAITGSPAGGGPPLATMNETLAEVPTLPAASCALATRLCPPSVTFAEFQGCDHGELVSDATCVPSTYQVTRVTPTLSDADAESVTVPDSVAPADGAVIETRGRFLPLRAR
jgi:hypothetical protein